LHLECTIYLPVALGKTFVIVAVAEISVFQVVQHRGHIALFDDVYALVHIRDIFYFHCLKC